MPQGTSLKGSLHQPFAGDSASHNDTVLLRGRGLESTVQAGEGVDGGQGRRRAAGVGREVKCPGCAVCSGHPQLLLLVVVVMLWVVVVLLLPLLLLLR